MPSLSFRAGIGQCFFFCINEFIYWMCWALFVYAIGIATTLAVVMESSHGSSGVRSLLWALNVGKSTLTASGGVTAWVCVWESTWVKSLSLRWLWGWGTDGGFPEWPIAVARFPLLRYLLGSGGRGVRQVAAWTLGSRPNLGPNLSRVAICLQLVAVELTLGQTQSALSPDCLGMSVCAPPTAWAWVCVHTHAHVALENVPPRDSGRAILGECVRVCVRVHV